jgi:1-acyl-sn-glycerol-3-phosphate acyltransferase
MPKRRRAHEAAKLDVSWARSAPARALREFFLSWVLSPLMNLYVRRRAVRRDALAALKGPVVFVANHASHMDTPVILRALPRRWRKRTAVAAAADYFYKNRKLAIAVSLAFGTVPIARCGGSLGRATLDHLDRLMHERWNVLLYPEGTRSRDGSPGRFKAGAAVIAERRGAPIVPIWISGTNEAMPPGQSWPKRMQGRFFPRRHQVEIQFGDPIDVRRGDDVETIKARVEAFFDAHRDAQAPLALELGPVAPVMPLNGREPVAAVAPLNGLGAVAEPDEAEEAVVISLPVAVAAGEAPPRRAALP